MRKTSPHNANNYITGNPWFICDECGKKYRSSEIQERWDGALVCSKDWEPRHPQEDVRAYPEKIQVYNPRPETYNIVINDNCQAETDWTVGTGWTLGVGFKHSSGTAVLERSITGLTPGSEYLLQILSDGQTGGVLNIGVITVGNETTWKDVEEDDILDVDGDPIGVALYGDISITLGGDGGAILADGQHDATFTAVTAAATLRLAPSSNFNGTVAWVGLFPAHQTVTQDSL